MVRSKRKFDFSIDDNNCFVCTSHKGYKGGYPQCRWNGKTANIHKIIYTECFGEVPKGIDIRHKCDNKKCINPEHMHTGTRQDNVNDAINRGLWPVGEKSGTAKLNTVKVKFIRKYLKNRNNVHKRVVYLSNKFNVTEGTIYAVYHKKSWKHIKEFD